VASCDIQLKSEILSQLPDIVTQYICNIDQPD
jgi:hypothetical protein